mgnify:CR=1 FL=1
MTIDPTARIHPSAVVETGAVIGAGLGFLWFNAPPAQIFMGDTGSLALGGALGVISSFAAILLDLGDVEKALTATPPPNARMAWRVAPKRCWKK